MVGEGGGRSEKRMQGGRIAKGGVKCKQKKIEKSMNMMRRKRTVIENQEKAERMEKRSITRNRCIIAEHFPLYAQSRGA